MKIALITIWHCCNYGAEMQTYATVKALTQLGHQVELIDFRLTDQNHKPFKVRMADLASLVTPSYYKFSSFWEEYLPVKKLRYRSLDELRSNPPKADLYMVGSDQVWNESITKDKAAAFFLDFGPENVKRASFSSSFGVNVWNGQPQLTNIAQKRFAGYCGISCREKTGLKILKDTFGITQAYNTLDPTLLFNDYSEILGSVVENDTLVYYPLRNGNTSLETVSNQLAEKLKLTLENANPYKMIPGTSSLVWNRNSIKQWMQTIAGARLVVTPSFHGVAFSILFHRQFVVLNLAKHGRQSRLLDLLDELGVGDRYYESIDALLNSDFINYPIDYNLVDSKLQSLRDRSWSYIKNILR